MEGIISPYKSDYNNIEYEIYENELCCVAQGRLFVEKENKNYGLEKKVNELNIIINNVLNILNGINDDNRNNVINNIKVKQNSLNNILKKYKKIKETLLNMINIIELI